MRRQGSIFLTKVWWYCFSWVRCQIKKGTDKNIIHLHDEPYMAFTRRKGNKRIAPISLNTTSRVNPIILNGRRISQIIGSKNTSISASGQQSTNRIHQRRITSNVLIESLFAFLYKHLTNQPFDPICGNFSIIALTTLRKCTGRWSKMYSWLMFKN